MNFKPIAIQQPTVKEKKALRVMIITGVIAMGFFLFTILQHANIGYYPLYVMLMITLIYYCLKFLHEWYHYFSISANEIRVTDKIYTVDILTTFCAGEPFDMLQGTLEAIQKITYPHTAWCCDEADDPEVKALCDRLGVKHVTRIIKKDAKAGNINNALQFATCELCVVLDPDHIPCPEFLDHVVAYFDDPKIGFVQIVQAYYNQKESLVAKGSAQQTYQFYGPMMMSMHSYGTVQAIGANCTFRRTALDSIGGHASGLSEDMHTAMQIHAKGWKSIYVPAILTRGLVPATLSSYYKQQLKWSRGTWELLVATYPKLFTKFTWRQKIHYFTLPFHYLAGIIFFINFLIPVISLFTGYIPLQMDILSFMLASFPLFAMGILIRHYVQKWVAEETERGFHIVGGILQIGTWWIHSVGFIYTLFRKKVPYIPTPKNDSDPLPLALNIPNISILLVSVAAICYGLWHDYNPYTIFMVGLASIQIFFMLFMLSVSGYIKSDGAMDTFSKKIRSHNQFIIKTHGFLRTYSVILSFLVISLFILGYTKHIQLPTFLPKPLPELQVFYAGLYQPSGDNGATNVTEVFSAGNQKKNSFSLIAFYINPKKDGKISLPADSIKKVYDNNAMPLISFSLLPKNVTGNEEKDLLQNITAGKYDTLIRSFASQAAILNKPLFLRLTLEPQNSFANNNTEAASFKSAWQYVHSVFDDAGADKIIWVWNPGNAEAIADFFPGKKYVDWLGVSVLDTAVAVSKTNLPQKTFDSLYRPYHRSFAFNGLPVMVTEAATLSANKIAWWNDAWKSMDTAFKEIKSVVFYNSKYDQDYTNDNKTKTPDWTTNLQKILINSPANNIIKEPATIPEPALNKYAAHYKMMDTLKSIVYDKGYIWFRNRHTLMLNTIENDVYEMKKIGINTIERTMPGFYDKTIGRVVSKNNMHLIARFGMLVSPLLLDDQNKMEIEKEKILALVKENLDNKAIVLWNLGEDGLYSLENQTYKPDYFNYNNKYITWLSGLCREIRLLDSVRPIVIDINWDVKGSKRLQMYKKYVPQINTYLLVADTKNKGGLKDSLSPDMAWGKVPLQLWDSIPAIKKSGMIPAWQDIETTDYISLNGLLDMQGRKKQGYRKVINTWSNYTVPASPIPDIKILRPAQKTNVGANLLYHVMYKNNSQWKLYKEEGKGIRFEWYLVRTDQYGNTMFIKKVGEGSSISLPIPLEPQYYQLYVEAVLGDDIRVVNSTLNTPLE